MTSQTKKSKRKLSARKAARATTRVEEIEVKLGATTAELKQDRKDRRGLAGGSDELEAEIGKLKRRNQRTVDGQAATEEISMQEATKALIQNEELRSEKKLRNIKTELSTLAITTPGGLTIQTFIHLSGTDALMLTRNQAPFQLAWYAHKIGGGGSVLLKTYQAQLAENKLEYTINVDADLTTGLYRLMTVITFPTPWNLIAHCQGPVVQASLRARARG